MKAMIDALNIAYEEDEKRGFIKLNLVSLAFTLGAMLFMVLASAAIVVIPIVLKFIGLGTAAEASSACRAGRCFWSASRSPSRCSIASAPAARAPMALGELGQRRGRRAVDRRVGAVLLVRREFRQLQRDLWFARRGHRLHDMDLDLHDRRSSPALNSTRRSSTRPRSTPPPMRPSRSARAAPGWPTRSARRRAPRSSARNHPAETPFVAQQLSWSDPPTVRRTRCCAGPSSSS